MVRIPSMVEKPLPVLRGLSVALAAVVVAGCASMSEDQCRRAAWGEVGRRDGAEGHRLDRLETHAKACAKVGVVPDAPLWRAGREEGLRLYCTAPKGREVAARGGGYTGVCEGADEQAFLRGFAVGRQIRELNQLLASNQSERQRALDRLAQKDVPDTERRGLRVRLISLDVDAERLRRLIADAERQRL
jgi:hypothetical protein